MRMRAWGAVYVAGACFLSGCASSPGVRQAKQTDPIIVVTVQSTPKKAMAKGPEAPATDLVEQRKKVLEEAANAGILGVLGGTGPDQPDEVFGGVVGGVIGGPSTGFGGFGGLGLSGTGLGGGTGVGIGGLGSITTYGRGSGTGSAYGGGFGIRGSSERARVQIQPVKVTGALLEDVVQRHVDEHRDDLQKCHDLERSLSGTRWGTLTLRFNIDAKGHVDDVQVYESSLTSRDLESCIAHTIGTFEFPPPNANGTASVLLPIRF